MNILDHLKSKNEKIEALKEEMYELKHELDGAETTYNNNNATIVHVDWEGKAVLLNIDDGKEEWEEWISFE
ncbi:hypothetical protein [Bacillus velezensis]|uniref:hypothetical protein n=1 Tax=Bacillus velezensis TaxID=492670 RepID=UPI00146BD232|nr:hypothetical protein [Bacillus velezensis]NMV98026.1 hypothetical protein [Bacillus velezensis]